jgi:hypothetical protein
MVEVQKTPFRRRSTGRGRPDSSFVLRGATAGGRPRRVGSTHRGGTIRNRRSSRTLQTGSVNPLAMAGVMGMSPRRACVWAALRRTSWCGKQTWSVQPTSHRPASSRETVRAACRQRRVRLARRSRHVACTRSIHAVCNGVPPCETARRATAAQALPWVRRRILSPTRCWAVFVIPVPMTISGQACRRLRPRPVVLLTFSRKARRRLPGEDAQPSVSTRSAHHGWQHALTIWHRVSASVRSRRRLTTPPHHTRVETIMAMAIHGIMFHPFSRISSACTWCRSRFPART